MQEDDFKESDSDLNEVYTIGHSSVQKNKINTWGESGKIDKTPAEKRRTKIFVPFTVLRPWALRSTKDS